MQTSVRLGPFELGLSTADLHRNGRKVRLPEQQFQILEMLLRGQGSLVSRDEIRKRLWPNDTVVEFDRSINAGHQEAASDASGFGGCPSFRRNCSATWLPDLGAGPIPRSRIGR